MNRDQYVEWCKKRAIEYFDRGDLANTVLSIISDMNKRDDTAVNVSLAQIGLICAISRDRNGVWRFIEGFR